MLLQEQSALSSDNWRFIAETMSSSGGIFSWIYYFSHKAYHIFHEIDHLYLVLPLELL